MTLDLRAILGNALAARYGAAAADGSPIATARDLVPVWQDVTGKRLDPESIRRALKRFLRRQDGGKIDVDVYEATLRFLASTTPTAANAAK